MVSSDSVDKQLKSLKFNQYAWGRAEVRELPGILMPDEEIYELVNGIYEGGFALLVATDVRLLLIDKKPLNFLTVEDLRFDMITELDYNHRLLGAYISIAAGSKNLKFRSYNQHRLRKLITHVQHCMAEAKKKQSEHQTGQNQHLQQINQQLQAYLLAQYQQNQQAPQTQGTVPQIRPDPQLADYLYAQSLLREYEAKHGAPVVAEAAPAPNTATTQTASTPSPAAEPASIYEAGKREVFGKRAVKSLAHPLEVNAFTIAYSKLPMAMRNRRFRQASSQAGLGRMPATY